MSEFNIHTKEGAFRLFDEAVTALINSKFIVTQKPITDLLRCLVFSDLLRSFIGECKKGVDYEAEAQAAIVQTETGHSFVLPKGNKRVIVLVTGLLRDFDMERISLLAFLREYYPVSDNHTRYKLFCEEVIKPYRNAFRQSFLYDNDDPGQFIEEPEQKIEQAVIEGASPLLAALRTVFLGDNKLLESKRDKLIYLTDGLAFALERGDVRMVKTVWTAMDLLFSDYKKAARKFADITNLLATYALI